MNVLCVTGNLSHADYLEHELGKIAPQIHIQVSPGIDDALTRLSVPGNFAAVLVDPVVNGGDAETLITCIRQQNLPVAAVIMSGPSLEDPPLKLLDAGADDYLVKKPNFVKSLPAMLKRVVERRASVNEQELPPFEVLHTGELQRARPYFRNPSMVKLQLATVDSDGCCVLPPSASGRFSYDAVVLDDAIHGVRILRALKDIQAQASDAPVILLITPGQEELASQGAKLGAAECILKTGDHFPVIASSVENALRRRDLARERVAMRSTEARLRLVIETIPACVTRLAPDGSFQAINWTGLSVLGATRLDQVVGKNLFVLVGPGEEERLREFVATVSGGEASSIVFDWDGLDGVARKLEFRAVPLGREPEPSRAILGVIRQLENPADTEKTAFAPPTAELQKLRSEYERVLQDQKAANAQWEEDRKKLEAEKESLAESLAEALHACVQKCDQIEQRSTEENSRLQPERDGLEKERVDLAAALHEAEIQNSEIAEQNRVAQAEQESRCRALEQQCRESEGRREIVQECACSAPPMVMKAMQAAGIEAAGTPALPQTKAVGFEQLHSSMGEMLRPADTPRNKEEDPHLLAQADPTRILYESREMPPGSMVQQLLPPQTASDLQAKPDPGFELKNRYAETAEKCAHLEKLALTQKQYIKTLQVHCTEIEAQWQARQSTSEAALADVESQRTVLMDKVHALELRQAELERQLNEERLQCENATAELNRRSAEAEQRCAELSTLRDTQEQKLRAMQAHCASMEALVEAAKTEYAKVQQEAERQRRLVGATVDELQTVKAEQQQRFESEHSRWESSIHEIETCRAQAEERCAQLEAGHAALERRRIELEQALQTSEDRGASLEQQYRKDMAQWEDCRRELLERQAILTDDLLKLEARKSELEEQCRRERGEWDSAALALQRQCAESEGKRAEIAARAVALAKALEGLETRHAALEQQYRFDQAEWDKKFQELSAERIALCETNRSFQIRVTELETLSEQSESQRRQSDIESRREVIDQALQSLELRCTRLSDQYRQEFTEWEAARQELTAQRDRSEVCRQEMEETSRVLGAQLAELQRVHSAEIAEWQRRCEELQTGHSLQVAELVSRSAQLEALLNASEAQCSEFEAKCLAEKTEADRRVQALAELQSQLEVRKETLEKTLATVELYQREQANTGQTEYRKLMEELEHQRAARISTEEMLRISEERRFELDKSQKAERAQWQSICREHERQRNARVALEEDLRSLELRLTQLVEEHRGDRVELEAVREELQRQRTARVALEDALRAAEERSQDTFAELAPAAGQAVADLVARITECVEILIRSVDPEDPRRRRAANLLESANEAGKIALRLLSLKAFQ